MHHRSGRRRRASASPGARRTPKTPVTSRSARVHVGPERAPGAVVVLTYWHDLDQEGVAATLGISRSTVARHLDRAHTKLRGDG